MNDIFYLNFLLPVMESDHCQVIQSHLYYRYTNGHCVAEMERLELPRAFRPSGFQDRALTIRGTSP